MKKIMLCLFLLSVGGLPALSRGAERSGDVTREDVQNRDIRQYELNHFIADYHYYEPGDIVPDIYLTTPYIIKAWGLRNLPPPVSGSHWTWMDGTYVMVTDDVGVIIRAISGDIFYSNRK
ncbi:TPA: RcnB family protein [Salmonella enterica]|nr:heavy metal resistance protein [Salmonella enterica subsp. arizonae]EEJ3293198.1 heavy metal resistance protein [Salmonella enterica subsp. diarizonae]